MDYSQPLREAVAEAERLVREAPHIETEADLLEGLQYLAGCVAGCMHLAFDYDRDHPFLHSGTGPFTKMGLDNPDTLYFGTRVRGGRIRGHRNPRHHHRPELPAARRSVHRRQRARQRNRLRRPRALHRLHGDFEWRFTPADNAQLVIREVYNDWTARRGVVAIVRTDTAGTAPRR